MPTPPPTPARTVQRRRASDTLRRTRPASPLAGADAQKSSAPAIPKADRTIRDLSQGYLIQGLRRPLDNAHPARPWYQTKQRRATQLEALTCFVVRTSSLTGPLRLTQQLDSAWRLEWYCYDGPTPYLVVVSTAFSLKRVVYAGTFDDLAVVARQAADPSTDPWYDGIDYFTPELERNK